MGVQHTLVASPHGDMTGEVLVKVGCPGSAVPSSSSAANADGPPAAKLPQPDGRADSASTIDAGVAVDGLSCSAFATLSVSAAATAEAAQRHAAAPALQRSTAATEAERAAGAAAAAASRSSSPHQQQQPPQPTPSNYMEAVEGSVGSPDSRSAGLPPTLCCATARSWSPDAGESGGCEIPAADAVAAAAASGPSSCFVNRAAATGAHTCGDVRENEAAAADCDRQDQVGDVILSDWDDRQPAAAAADRPRVSRARSGGGARGYSRIDTAAARRLARRLYNLEGFKRSDVVKHLSKSNDFARLVADEYLQHFDFSGLTLVEAMRAFFGLHPLPVSIAESPEQQCVAAHVARRYVSCNPGFLSDTPSRSEDACRTLACAILLLNANLHGQNAGKKILLSEFVKDVQSLHSGYVYSEPLLRSVYSDMQLETLSHAEASEDGEQLDSSRSSALDHVTSHVPLGAMETGAVDYLDGAKHSARTERTLMQMSKLSTSFEYKRGYVRRKCCKGANGIKLPLGKRSWKTVFAVLRGTTLRLAESEPAYDHDAVKAYISVDNALASVASDYKKSGCVFRLETADGSEYLLQTGDSLDLEDWVEVINLVAASMSCSAEPPAPPCLDFGSPRSGRAASKRVAINSSSNGSGFLESRIHTSLSLPGAGTLYDGGIGLDLKSRMKEHDWRIAEIEHELADRSRQPSPASNGSGRLQAPRSLAAVAAQADERWLLFELKRRRIYSELLKKKLAEFPELDTSFEITAIGECDEPPLSPHSLIGPTSVRPWGSL